MCWRCDRAKHVPAGTNQLSGDGTRAVWMNRDVLATRLTMIKRLGETDA
jgi:hypothetical protein